VEQRRRLGGGQVLGDGETGGRRRQAALGQPALAHPQHPLSVGGGIACVTVGWGALGPAGHPAHHLGARRERQWRPALVAASDLQQVGEAQPHRLDLEDHLAGLGSGERRLLEAHDRFGLAQLVHTPDPHDDSSADLAHPAPAR
jgi:hypothetical protein